MVVPLSRSPAEGGALRGRLDGKPHAYRPGVSRPPSNEGVLVFKMGHSRRIIHSVTGITL